MYGFLNCYKPPGVTSRDVVNVVQRRLRKQAKVGHAGTLDPLAEGVLVLGVGPAVRLVSYVQQLPKHYRAKFRFGVSTITGDLEGELTEHAELPVPTLGQVQTAASGLVGIIEQRPPAHSAIWVDGKRAYKRIRAGEEFEMPTRKVRVDRLDVTDYRYPEVELNIVCGSGTYVRTLGIDLARACGSIAVMSYLCRVAVGPFQHTDAVSLEQLRDDDLESMLVTAAVGVKHLPSTEINEAESERLGNGLCIDRQMEVATEDVAALTTDGQLRAILRQKARGWCPCRVFPISDR